jgi:hypothetical protein
VAEPYIQGALKHKVKVGVIFYIYFFMIWSRFGHAMSLICKSSEKVKTMLRNIFLASFFIKIRIISWGQL